MLFLLKQDTFGPVSTEEEENSGGQKMASVPNFFSPCPASWTGYKPYRELVFLSQIATPSTAGEKDLKPGRAHIEKTDTYHLASGE